MSQSLRTSLMAFLAAVALSGASGASAQVRQAGTLPASRVLHPALQRTIIGNAVAAPHPTKVKVGPHTRFGTIVSLQANSFVMRTRARGRMLTVDATVPLQAGTYSYPLFVGKLVMVTGDVDAAGVMHADTITRIPSIETQTPGDR